MNATIGQRIREARERAVLEQTELAQLAGIARVTLWEIEHGRRRPRPPTIRKIAAALGVNPSDLLDSPPAASLAPPP